MRLTTACTAELPAEFYCLKQQRLQNVQKALTVGNHAGSAAGVYQLHALCLGDNDAAPCELRTASLGGAALSAEGEYASSPGEDMCALHLGI